MRAHVDWITFTMPMIYLGVDTPTAYADAIRRGFMDMFGEKLVAAAFGGGWRKGDRGRAPYTDSWQLDTHGITLFASETLTHCCVEISGKGCEKLISLDQLRSVLQHSMARVTRIDIACDILSETKPTDFIEQVTHERMRASGHYVSETGETCYVGSQKSERYARVYRYNKPHPRSHLLRAEHVFRRAVARQVAHEITSGGLEPVVRECGNVWGWNADCWEPAKGQSANIRVATHGQDNGKTVFWLVSSVAPAFKRLLRDGTILDGEEFLRRYFLLE